MSCKHQTMPDWIQTSQCSIISHIFHWYSAIAPHQVLYKVHDPVRGVVAILHAALCKAPRKAPCFGICQFMHVRYILRVSLFTMKRTQCRVPGAVWAGAEPFAIAMPGCPISDF